MPESLTPDICRHSPKMYLPYLFFRFYLFLNNNRNIGLIPGRVNFEMMNEKY